MGLFDDSGLPDKLKDPKAWEGKDDDQHFYTRWRKHVKGWFAFSWRSPAGIALTVMTLIAPFWAVPVQRQWDGVPKVIWAEKGPGYWRLEADGKPDLWTDQENPKQFLKENPGYYVSRIQLWTEHHQAVQWPIFYSFHKYNDPKDVIPLGTKEDRDGRIKMAYFGAKKDPDTYWFPSFFAGENFK